MLDMYVALCSKYTYMYKIRLELVSQKHDQHVFLNYFRRIKFGIHS